MQAATLRVRTPHYNLARSTGSNDANGQEQIDLSEEVWCYGQEGRSDIGEISAQIQSVHREIISLIVIRENGFECRR
jgi:hypothetical protein